MEKGKWAKKPDLVKLACGIAILGLLVWEKMHGSDNSLVIFIGVMFAAQIADSFYGPAQGKRVWTKRPDPIKLVFSIAMLGLLIWGMLRSGDDETVVFIALVLLPQITEAFSESSLGKGQWKKTPDGLRLACGIAMLGLSVWGTTLDIGWGIVLIQAISALQEIVFAFYEEPQPAADPRPLKERYLEQMQKCSNEELQKILKDPLRGEEIKQVAENILKKRPLC